MNPTEFFREPLTTALGWALLHFLWQGALIALVLAVANASLPRASTSTRYALACGAMALMVLAVAGTFTWLRFTAPLEPAAAAGGLATPATEEFAASHAVSVIHAIGLKTRLAVWLPWLDCLWLAGVLMLSARSVLGWTVTQRLKHSNLTPLDPAWEQCALRLAQALKVSRPVRFSKSMLARIPAAIGWLRPVILVPVSAFAGLDPEQLEALLAHELAHIRRHDYLVNLLQTAAETLLFYHPAVWWVSRKIRIERENCCDDLAVSACGDVLTYARALTRLEELRTGSSLYAMAADGGALLARVRRLIAPGQPAVRRAKPWLAGALAAFTVCAVWAGARVSAERQAEASGLSPAFATASFDGGELELQAVPAPSQRQGSASKPPAQAESKGFIGDLADAGYPNLTADQLIAFKIHGVTPEYIRQLRAVGVADLTPDELVAFRIHGAGPEEIAELQSAGLGKLKPDQIVAARIHGVTPEYAKRMKSLGFGEVSIDQLIATKIHDITPEFANEIKALGLTGMTIDELIAFRIHGVDAAKVKEIASLGLGTPVPDQVVAMAIHGITPEFVRSLKDAGLTKLSYDDVIRARIRGITSEFIKEVLKHGFKDLTLDQLIRLKQARILSSDPI